MFRAGSKGSLFQPDLRPEKGALWLVYDSDAAEYGISEPSLIQKFQCSLSHAAAPEAYAAAP